MRLVPWLAGFLIYVYRINVPNAHGRAFHGNTRSESGFMAAVIEHSPVYSTPDQVRVIHLSKFPFSSKNPIDESFA